MRLTSFVIMLAALAGVLLALAPALAEETEEIKAAHRTAALSYFDTIQAGIVLEGAVLRNDSPGRFKACYFDDAWLVKQTFGEMVWYGYTGPENSWSGSNYSLPYIVEPEDNPANASLELLTSGEYLDDPFWEHFHFKGEDAGGYNIQFSPPDLPVVNIVLYSDPDEPFYLQIMSLELAMAEDDPECVSYRGFTYYQQDEEGRVLTSRETGRELDASGETINFVEFIVEDVSWPDKQPADMEFEFSRQPFSKSATAIKAPIDIYTNTENAYFLVPVNFSGVDETYWFILDTGASSSLFTPATAVAAGLVPSLTLPTHGHGSRAEFSVGLCTTASIGEAGDEVQVPLDGFTATAIPEDSEVLMALAFYEAAGILGVAPLHQYVATFDYAGETITFIPPELFDAEEVMTPHTYVINLDVEDLIYCPAVVGDEHVGEVVIDSGLQEDLALLRETMEYYEVDLEVIDERNNTVVGGIHSFDYVLAPSFELTVAETPEGHRPLRMEGAMASLTNDDYGTMSARKLLGFVGMTLFFDVKITLDLFNQKLYYEVPEDMVLSEDGLAAQLISEGDEESDDAEVEEDSEQDQHTKLPVDIG